MSEWQKEEYFSNKIDEHRYDSLKLWQQLKALGYSKKKKKKKKTESETKVELDIDGETCFDANKGDITSMNSKHPLLQHKSKIALC